MPGGAGGPSSLTYLFLCSENFFVPLFLPLRGPEARGPSSFHGLHRP